MTRRTFFGMLAGLTGVSAAMQFIRKPSLGYNLYKVKTFSECGKFVSEYHYYARKRKGEPWDIILHKREDVDGNA